MLSHTCTHMHTHAHTYTNIHKHLTPGPTNTPTYIHTQGIFLIQMFERSISRGGTINQMQDSIPKNRTRFLLLSKHIPVPLECSGTFRICHRTSGPVREF